MSPNVSTKKEASMILVRDLFQLKFGKARVAKALWKEEAALKDVLGSKEFSKCYAAFAARRESTKNFTLNT